VCLLPSVRWLLAGVVLCLGGWPLQAQEQPGPRARPAVLVVANGADDGLDATEGFANAFAAAGLPWYLRTLRWTAPDSASVMHDVKDVNNHRARGAFLAQAVLAWRAAAPDLAICLAGHSAGAAVVLAAAEQLPPGSIDRIILLAPAVAASYDLRPALRGVRCGIDAFCSEADLVFTGPGSAVRPPERPWDDYAGQRGFRFQVAPGEEELYRKLRQHHWHEGVAWTGYRGGHFACTRPKFLYYYVLPLLLEAAVGPGPG
jgi:predicted esterase